MIKDHIFIRNGIWIPLISTLCSLNFKNYFLIHANPQLFTTVFNLAHTKLYT